MFYEKRLIESLEKKYSLKENIENVKRMTETLSESPYVRDNGSFTMSYLSMIEKELDKYDFPTDGVDPDRIESTKYYDNFDRTRVLANIQIDPEFEVIYTYIEIGINNTVSENEFNLSEIEEALNWCELNAKKYVKKRMTEEFAAKPKYQPPGDTKVTCMVSWWTKYKSLDDYKEVPERFDLEIKDFNKTAYSNDYEIKLYGTIDNLIRYLQYSGRNGFEVRFYDRIKPDNGRMLYLVRDYDTDRMWASVYSPRSEKYEREWE